MSIARAFPNIVVVGFGSIGQALLPALLRHAEIPATSISVITPLQDEVDKAKGQGIEVLHLALARDNLEPALKRMLSAGDLLINVSTDVSSLDVIKVCRDREAFYLDTCVEPWPGGYEAVLGEQATNAWLREQALAFNRSAPCAPTAVIAHGANPGIISHLVKEGLRQLARMRGVSTKDSFAGIAHNLGIKVIQVAERDTQYSEIPLAAGEFANTWSSVGFQSEALQRAELGWGTHEAGLPPGALRLSFGDCAGIALAHPGAEVKVKSWVPSVGEQEAYLISHHEALSLSSMLTLGQPDLPFYRPTVYYAYHPSDLGIQSLEAWKAGGYPQDTKSRLIREEITQGMDQLGALFVYDGGAYWYGSTVTIDDARNILPDNNATSLQVVGGILAAMQWIRENPQVGVVEAEDMDHEAALAMAYPYLGKIAGISTHWQPSDFGKLQLQDFLIS